MELVYGTGLGCVPNGCAAIVYGDGLRKWNVSSFWLSIKLQLSWFDCFFTFIQWIMVSLAEEYLYLFMVIYFDIFLELFSRA